LIRPRQQLVRNCITDLFCGLEVNDEFKSHRLLHRQISRFGAFQDLVYVNSRAPIAVSGVFPLEHETALVDKLLLWVNSRQAVFDGKLDDPLSFAEERASRGRHNRLDLLLLGGFKGAL